jgi:hypothetical protein
MLNRFQRALRAPFPSLAARQIKAQTSAKETLWSDAVSKDRWQAELSRAAAEVLQPQTWISAARVR